MLERFKTEITLQKRVPEYRSRADFYRERAIKDSLIQGVFVDRTSGVELIEGVETSVIQFGDTQIEFAIDQDGVCFAKIEDGMYYPIDTSLSESNLKLAKRYDKLATSAWRRFWNESYERQYGKTWFELNRAGSRLLDSTANLTLLVQQLNETMEGRATQK